MKVCTKCGIEKHESKFYKRKSSKDGLRGWCKFCDNLQGKIYYKENKEKIKQNSRKYSDNNKEKIKEYSEEYYKKNKEKINEKCKKYYEENKEEIKLRHKKWKLENQEHTRNYIRDRRRNDILFKILNNLRSRIYNALKGKSKSKTTLELLGCTPEFLREHLENKFQSGMSFENYGDWHIDHIIPLSSVDMVSELYKLCHYTNLQPLWAADNLRKSNKILNAKTN